MTQQYAALAGGARHAESRRPQRKRTRVIAALVTIFALVVGSFVAVNAAQAYTTVFEITSLAGDASAKDAKVGDGVCATASGECTLYAAIEESNALNQSAGDILITPAAGVSGNIDPTQAMTSGYVGTWEGSGSWFEITAPVTIDLKNEVTIETGNDRARTVLHINGPDVTLLNVTQILGGEASIVASPNAKNLLIDGGSSITQAHYGPERFLVIREGAENITLQNYQLQGFFHSGNATGLIYFDARAKDQISNVVVDNLRVTTPTNTTCNAVNGSGCQTNLVEFSYPTNTYVDGFTFTNSFMSNMDNRDSFPLGSSYISDIKITNNQFINVRGISTGFVTLPNGPIPGENIISGNEFVASGTGTARAISWDGGTANGGDTDLTISNNYFDAYTGEAIFLYRAGDVLVEKNTFGSRTPGHTGDQVREESSVYSKMLRNYTRSNNQVATWYPTGNATVVTGATPEDVTEVGLPSTEPMPVCVATMDIAKPTSGNLPAEGSHVDLYWTTDHAAEVYLGRAENLNGDTDSLLINLPVGEQEFPTTIVGGSETISIVDAETGLATGKLRLQTVDPVTGQSSQYSRTTSFEGTCMPTLTIDQAEGQNDETVARDLHFTMKSTLPLDSESVTSESVQVTAEATDLTIDAARMNPQVISVEPVAGTDNKEFTVVVHVDDSAVVTATVPGSAVTSSSGVPNIAAATSTDNQITFVNPVTVSPQKFTLVTGEPDGKQYRFSLRAGAPEPTADLNFGATADEAATQHGVSVSDSALVIEAGERKSGTARVTAEAGEVAANTPVGFAHTMETEDPNYAGLVIRPLTVQLFSTDPSVHITKRAFVDVADTSTPESIMATGTEALSGTRLMDGQAVCFVYTVTNISTDDWTTSLSDVAVTDTDTRLGVGGVIGTIPTLQAGETVQLSACAPLIPVDTTVNGQG